MQTSRDEAVERVKKYVRLFEMHCMTDSDVENALVPLVHDWGAEMVLPELPGDMLNILYDWEDSAPQTSEEWENQKVFEFRDGLEKMQEAVIMPMKAEEITGRKKVIEAIRSYRSKNTE